MYYVSQIFHQSSKMWYKKRIAIQMLMRSTNFQESNLINWLGNQLKGNSCFPSSTIRTCSGQQVNKTVIESNKALVYLITNIVNLDCDFGEKDHSVQNKCTVCACKKRMWHGSWRYHCLFWDKKLTSHNKTEVLL